MNWVILNAPEFPGIFSGALDVRAKRIITKMKIVAAEAIANLIIPSEDQVIPSPLDKKVVPTVAEAVKKAWLEETK